MNMKSIAAAAFLGAAVVAGTNAAASASTTAPKAIPLSAHDCKGISCVSVNGSGLHVNYAVAINNSTSSSGNAFLSESMTNKTWEGPVIGPGGTWRKDFNTTYKKAGLFCGSVSGIDVACVHIEA